MWVHFLGCLLIAYGPACSLFWVLVSPKAQNTIVLVLSAFFNLIAFLLASTLWWIFPASTSSSYLFWLLVLAASQELLRFIFFRVYHRAETHFKLVAINGIVFPLSDFGSAIAAGLGFGVTQALALYGSSLGNALGPGTLFSDSCPHLSVFTLAALTSMFNIFQHCFWMVIAFDSYRRASWWRLGYVIGSHTFASMITWGMSQPSGCLVAFPMHILLLLCNTAITTYCIMQPSYRSRLHQA